MRRSRDPRWHAYTEVIGLVLIPLVIGLVLLASYEFGPLVREYLREGTIR